MVATASVSIRQPLIQADDVLADSTAAAHALQRDQQYGNRDLVHVMQVLDMAGPYTVVSPWEIEDAHGRRYLNATGYSALPFGELAPELTSFLRAYLQRNRAIGLPQQSASPWRAALAHNLIALLAHEAPSHSDSEVHFANSGAEAVENAIKFVRSSRPNAQYLIGFDGAYHGLTWMALTLTGSRDYQAPFQPLVPQVLHLPFGDYEALEAKVRELGPDNVAGVVLEPIQGEAGVIIPPDGFLRAVGELCRLHGIVVVADEIQTGLGRTGHWFETVAQGLEPDVITLGKHLSGGLVPIGVTIARRELCQKAIAGLGCGRMASTYSGNSLALATALKALELLVEDDLPARSAQLGAAGLERLRHIQAAHADLLDSVRGAGLLFALQFHPVIPPTWARGQKELIGEFSGILGMGALHNAGVEACLSLNDKRIVRLTPPLTIPDDLFEKMWDRVERVADLNHPAWHLLLRTHLHTLLGLASLARTS
jgi:acetylornithine/succinyldiaminopimelate/putrescine aminotransferase